MGERERVDFCEGIERVGGVNGWGCGGGVGRVEEGCEGGGEKKMWKKPMVSVE